MNFFLCILVHVISIVHDWLIFFSFLQGSDISNLIGQYMQVINRHKKRPEKMSLQRYHWWYPPLTTMYRTVCRRNHLLYSVIYLCALSVNSAKVNKLHPNLVCLWWGPCYYRGLTESQLHRQTTQKHLYSEHHYIHIGNSALMKVCIEK